MDFFKNIFIIIITILLGIFIGKFIYNSSKIDSYVFKENNKVYLMQYGVYRSISLMKESSSNLPNYFYFKDKDGYHVIIGVVENKKNSKKIEECYALESNIYLKEVNINNMEFIESLRQYEKLISSSNDNSFIINAEKQVLSKYEELVLNE